MISRNIDKSIENHYTNSKSALLLTGARQVGKTFAFRRYAPIYMTMFLEKKRVVSETKYVLDMNGLR